MKDGIDYAEMLGLEVSSCDVTIKPKKNKKKKDIIGDILKKVNAPKASAASACDGGEVGAIPEKTNRAEKKKGKFAFDIVYAEGVAAFVLVVSILLTNIFWENSGINRLFKRAFGGAETAVTDTRVNTNFNAKAPSGELEVKLENGVMEYSGKGSLYPVCDGKVVSVVEEDGKYTVTVKHSDVFKSVISGVDFVYADKGDEVFKYVPVCFVNDGTAKVYMYNQDALITDYVIEGGSIVWAN